MPVIRSLSRITVNATRASDKGSCGEPVDKCGRKNPAQFVILRSFRRLACRIEGIVDLLGNGIVLSRHRSDS